MPWGIYRKEELVGKSAKESALKGEEAVRGSLRRGGGEEDSGENYSKSNKRNPQVRRAYKLIKKV